MISERVVREDIYTSIHVSEYTLEVRDTKRGVEELTAAVAARQALAPVWRRHHPDEHT